ncbi:Lrp/AsnC family transcriptional regulator [Acuticoccus sp. MNP-M23]|uniref:Lrp/AsnC family transcriptional regulator n=1 Tax=Acuticoccus sp. MNP-M23 TaxID=3072793 RepID=UPI0028159B69|nr:Lrp/AsnC family transcriptional regulator [Acuticoccus sp. MNP-M23]WMS41761.1 Lrp/AsnC family transcriptional regulator [Acuticoccus sp. MNP-M23]
MEKSSVDAIDVRILRAMQVDASRSVAEIGAEVGLSQTPCWRRIKRLRDSGIIRSVVAILDSEALGLGFKAYALVKLSMPSTQNMERFDAFVSRCPEVVMCERITGAVDYLIKVISTDIKEYDEFLRHKLLASDLVSDVQSRIVVATVKDTTALPLHEK